MSSCLSGGGRVYGIELGVMKSSSTSTRTSNNSSSPSSTLSESSNSPIFVCTRKPRTQRKRPNQKYNEAAALLSTAYPSIFSSENLSGTPRFSLAQEGGFFDESSELLLPFRDVEKCEFLLHHDTIQENERPGFGTEMKVSPLSVNPCQSPGEVEIQSIPMEFFNGFMEDFDADSILDEEIEEGMIDAIMGDMNVDADKEISAEPSTFAGEFDFGFKFGKGALRNVHGENNWWDYPFPTVEMFEISPRFGKSPVLNSSEKKKKNIEKPTKPKEEPKSGSESTEANQSTEELNPKPKLELLLKLNYNGILSEWSGRGCPFPDSDGSNAQATDLSTRLAQIELFPESGAVREASVQRYKEKRQTRLFSKKIRYQVRKVTADQRPRMKGRFVRQSNSSSSRKRSNSGSVKA